MMKHVNNTSQSRSLYRENSLRGSDTSLTCSSLSEDSVTILDERADMEHGQLARHVWDRFTSGSDLGLGKSKAEHERKSIDSAKKNSDKEQVETRKEEKVPTVASTKKVSGGQGDLGEKNAESVPVPLHLPINRLKKDGDTSLLRRVGLRAKKHKHLVISVVLFLCLCLALYLVLLVWSIRAGSCRNMPKNQ